MLQWAIQCWDLNKSVLEKYISENINEIDNMKYEDLFLLCLEKVINPNVKVKYNTKRITTIDDGDYQGALLFIVPQNTYLINPDQYIMTYVYYGSCSGCDTLLCIRDNTDLETKVKDYITLCKDLICNIIEPFNKDN